MQPSTKLVRDLRDARITAAWCDDNQRRRGHGSQPFLTFHETRRAPLPVPSPTSLAPVPFDGNFNIHYMSNMLV